jgi:hypothetical protein
MEQSLPLKLSQIEILFKYNKMNTSIWEWSIANEFGSGTEDTVSKLTEITTKSKYITNITIEFSNISTIGQKICNVESLCITSYNGGSKKLTPAGKTTLKDKLVSELKKADIDNTTNFGDGC